MNLRKVYSFIVTVFVLDWSLAGGFYLSGLSLSSVPGFAMVSVFMFMPAIVAVVLQKFVFHAPIKDHLGEIRPNWWWLSGWLGSPLIALAALVVGGLIVGFSPHSTWLVERLGGQLTSEQIQQMQDQLSNPMVALSLSFMQALLAGGTINAVFGFGEEMGWRGYLHQEMKRLGFWKMSWAIGSVWGLWHAPIILMGHNFPQHPIIGVFVMTTGMILLSPLFTYVRNKSRSAIAAGIMHGTFNASYGLSVLFLAGSNDLLTSVMGLPGLIVFAALNMVLVFVPNKD